MIPGSVAGSGIVAPEGAAEARRPVAVAAEEHDEADRDRREHANPTISVMVRLRLRADCLRWISSRSIRACSLRSAFVSR